MDVSPLFCYLLIPPVRGAEGKVLAEGIKFCRNLLVKAQRIEQIGRIDGSVQRNLQTPQSDVSPKGTSFSRYIG